jgi:hypothetical protein
MLNRMSVPGVVNLYAWSILKSCGETWDKISGDCSPCTERPIVITPGDQIIVLPEGEGVGIEEVLAQVTKP